MATHFDLPPLQPFDPYTDPSSVGQRWKSWRRRFQTYIVALNVTDKTQQRALLLYQVGQATQEIFDTIPNNGADDDYKTALDKLDAYFLPKKNIDYEIFQFRQAIQQSGETVDQYATRLRKLAAHCEFEKVDNEIKPTIIQNCSSKSLRRYALREEKLTLELLLNKARALEVSESQATGMEQTLNHSEKTVERANFVKGNRNSSPKKPFHVSRSPGKCKHCGYTWPHTKSPCPAKGKQCNACGKDNHFSSVCRSKGTTQRSKGRVNRVTDTASTQETQATPATNEKEKMKKNRDKANRAKESEIDVGDTVLVKQIKNNKFSTKFDARPYKVTRKKGTMITAERNDHIITRNVSHFKKMPNDMNNETMSDLEDDIDFDDLQKDAIPRRYPIRERRQVQRYGQNIHI